MALLARCPDTGGLNYWSAALGQPNGQAVFASSLANSDESLRSWVEGAYALALNRNADPGGLTYWTNRLRSGLRWDQMEATFFATDEAYALAYRSNAQFVENLYVLLLYRDADVGGLTYWANRLNAGASRYSVAMALETSGEAETDWALGIIGLALGRFPTNGEAIFVGALVKLTGDPYKALGAVASIPEFSQYAQTMPELPSEASQANTPTAAANLTAPKRAPSRSAAGIIRALASRSATS
jgi:hypothetical protein